MIIGGEIDAIERCRAVLEVMGTIFHCGDVGMGMVAKLVNNGIAIASSAVILEMRAMARAYDMDMEQLMGILRNSTANSFIVENWEALRPLIPRLSELGVKDADLCIAACQAKGLATPMLTAWRQTDYSNLDPETA